MSQWPPGGAYWTDSHLALYVGNCLHMDAIPDGSVHCVVTSPPYLSKRKYKTEPLIWGALPGCPHEWGAEAVISRGHPGDRSTLKGPQTAALSKEANTQGATCKLCGAWRGHLGLEPSPEMFIGHLIEIFREVKKKLRDDGCCFVNMGDTHAGSGGAGGDYAPGGLKEGQPTYPGIGDVNGLPPGDLIGIPWRFALAMQADGWHLHQDIIWHKPAPMPESVNGVRWERHRVKVMPSARADAVSYHAAAFGDKPQGARDGREFADHASEWADCPGCPECAPNDGLVLRRGSWRPTNSHEYIFMFSKGAHYFSDREAVKEAKMESTLQDPRTNDNGHRRERGYPGSQSNGGTNLGGSDAGRNLRSVWKIGPEPFSGAHFATFPSELPSICIRASTSEAGVCPKCGSQWARVVSNKPMQIRRSEWGEQSGNRTASSGTMEEPNETETLGWRATCQCGETTTVPATVLDPFAGTFTTGLAAKRLGRRAIGYELSAEYAELAIDRNRQGGLL